MGNWASTLAQQDASRTRLVIIFVSVTIALGMVLVCVGGAMAYKSKKNREDDLARLEREIDLETAKSGRQGMEYQHAGGGVLQPPSGPPIMGIILDDNPPGARYPPKAAAYILEDHTTVRFNC